MVNKTIAEPKGDVYTEELKESLEELKSILADYHNRLSQIDSSIVGLQHRLDDIENNQIFRLESISEKISPLKYSNLELLNISNSSNSERKKLLLIGFYGAPNLGDELMLETLLQYLENKGDSEITVMLCNNSDYDIRKYGNVYFIHYPSNMFDINSIVSYFDTIIFGGGAIVDDSLYSVINPNFNDLGTILIELGKKTILKKKELFCIGLSTNKELKRADYKQELSYIIEHSNHFSLRDKNSFDTLHKASIDTSKIALINDIVLGNKEMTFIGNKTSNDIIKFGVNLICNKETEEYLSLILDSLINYGGSKKVEIELIPFYLYQDNDTAYYKELTNKPQYENVVKISRPPVRMYDLINILKNKDFVVSMRYHCFLIALVAGIPTATIYYSTHRHYYNKIAYLKELFDASIVDFLEFKNKNFDFNHFLATVHVVSKKKSVSFLKDTRKILIQLSENIRKVNSF